MNILTLNQKHYKAVPAEMLGMPIAGKQYPSCNGCAFHENDIDCKSAQAITQCIAEYRPDNRNIIWIEQNEIQTRI